VDGVGFMCSGGRLLWSRSLLALVCALGLLVSACGARVGAGQVRAASFGAGTSGLSGVGVASGPVAGGSTGVVGNASGPGSAGQASGASVANSSTAQFSGASAAAAGASSGGAASPVPAGGNGGSTDVGVTGTQILTENISDLSGPVPGLFQGAPYGVQAYYDYINSQGGVYGRQLVQKSVDDQFSCSQNEAETSSAVGSAFALVGSGSLFDNCGAQVLASHPDVSDVHTATTAQASQLPNNFSYNAFHAGSITGPFLWLKQHYPAAITKVGLLAGVSQATNSINTWEKGAMASLGYKIIYEDDFNPVQNDFTSDVIRMRADGVQMVIFLITVTADAANLAAEMQQQNWHPQAYLAGSDCYDSSYISEAGASAVEGDYIYNQNVMFNGEDAAAVPEIQTYLAWMHRDYPNYSSDSFSFGGWVSAMLFVQALRAAGPKVSRKALLAALKQIKSFNADGLIPNADPADKIATHCYVMIKVHNGAFVRADPPAGFLCGGFWTPPS